MKDELIVTPADEENQILHLRSKSEVLARQVKELARKLGEQEELAQRVVEAVQAAEPPKPFRYGRARNKTHPVVPVLKLSDWHIGEVINAKEIEGFNKFDWETAQHRAKSIVEDWLRWIEIQRKFYHIEECALFCEGDYISGDIHQELLVTNEFPLPVQTANAGILLGEVLCIVAGHFKQVRAVLVGADNHGRLTKKPQGKQKAANNMSHLVHTIATTYAQRCGNIRYEIAQGMKYLAKVNGFQFLIEHGDTIKGWAGLPYYGFSRSVGRESRRRMNSDRGFHYYSLAHFHVPCVIEGSILVNGSLSGTSEFDHSQGRHAEPAQVGFLVHPRHGIFNWTPFKG